MDSFKSSIDDFEFLLQRQSYKKPSILYNENLNRSEQTYKPQDVINTVSSQIKAFQLADCVKSDKSRKPLDEVKKSHFISLNKLPVYGSSIQEMPNSNLQKFETQCVLDTQLIDIIDGAVLVSNTGITQEFDTSFAHNEDMDCGSAELIEENHNNDKRIRKQESDLNKNTKYITKKFPNRNRIGIITSQNNKVNKPEIDPDIEISNVNNSISIIAELNSEMSKTADEETVTFTENFTPTQKENEQSENAINNSKVIDIDNTFCSTQIDTGQDIERSPSPVLIAKSKKKKFKLRSSLVVSLENFRSFENIAMPLIEENDFETAKHIINSQIFGKELCLNDSHEVEEIKRDNSVSDFKSNKLRKSSESQLQDIKDVTVNRKILEDEILFSSDEEDLQYTKSRLPLTCVSKASKNRFDDGFQTASNKSSENTANTVQQDPKNFDDNESDFPLTCALESNIHDGFETSSSNKPKQDTVNKTENEMRVEQDAENFTSQIFNTKYSARNIRTPSPFVVSLKTFENFANDAMALVNETDFETAKYLIHSQMSGNELCPNNDEVLLHDFDRNISPVLNFNVDELRLNSSDLMYTKRADKVNLHDTKDGTEKYNETHNDEILFSSDEEDSTMEVSQNLPQTCVLKTSDDQPNILEETFYVSFQTASNKSIKISRDSYEHAQNILSKDDKTDNDSNLTELVEKCDSIRRNPNEAVSTTTKTIKYCETEAMEETDVFVDFKESLKKEIKGQGHPNIGVKHPNIGDITEKKHKGFMMANNKKISMSDKALERCQKVLKYIDLDENFDVVELSKSNFPAFDEKSCKNYPEENEGCKLNLEEDALDKINDELFLEEFKDNDMFEESNNKCINKEYGFEGFKTANNKNIKISSDALVKPKKLLRDIDAKSNEHLFDKSDIATKHDENTIIDVNQTLTSKPELAGFKTANNKEIKISDKALAKSRNIFKDIGVNKNRTKTIEDIINEPSTSNSMFVGFKTASNRDITISNEALFKTKFVFKDVDKEQTKKDTDSSTTGTVKCKPHYSRVAEILGKNAKKVSSYISEEMVAQYEIGKLAIKSSETRSDTNVNIFDQVITKEKVPSDTVKSYSSTINISKETGKDDTKTGYVGFKTASNKPVNVSAEALQISKKLFLDLDSIDSNDKTQPSKDKINDLNDYIMFESFQTANKNPVTVSADALVKSKAIFKDINEINSNLFKKIQKNSNVEFQGFQTANQKPVQINKEALKASQLMLNDQIESSVNAYVGFKTASNKNVITSDETLAKCKKIFKDIDTTPIIYQETDKFITKAPFFKGFQTGNKNKVEISKEALEKTKNIFDDISELRQKDRGNSLVGFQTARNNKVTVSEEALTKSRQLFQDINTESNISVPKKESPFLTHHNIKNDTKCVFGFKTATNKEITVSGDALTKSRKVFAECFEKYKDTAEQSKTESADKEVKKDILNIDNILDTQVINDFNEDVCTEDFRDPRPNKRSGSPILMCPKAKKRKKFETPYIINKKTIKELHENPEDKPKNIIHFSDDYKKNKTYNLKDLMKFEKDKNKNIDPYIFNFSLENLLNFEFDESRNDFTDGKMTINDIKTVFIEATDKKLIPDGWLDIHLKLVLWKLISYEIKFPNSLGKVCTVRNIIDQLKYRYDKELYNAERPVLRKILEKDDVPSKTMVLCVAGIYVDGVCGDSIANLNNIELLLTDGWYFIKATIDNMLSKLVYDGKIVVGSKVVTCGAELINCEEGVAPWEDTSSIRLSIFGNSTRPARWDEKLGLRPCSIVAGLAAVRVGGGKVSRLRARVVRVYPRLYVEKFQDGSTVTRSERLELQHQMKYEAERESIIEKIYEEVEKEMSDLESQNSDRSDPCNKRKGYDSGSQIAKLMKTSNDPMEFRAQLTSSQAHLLQDHESKQRDKYLQTIQDRVQERLQNRNVITLARGRIAALERDGDRVTITKGMLSIWKPNDDVLDIFKEGAWFEVTNVVPTAFRNSEIQLTAGRQSMFRPVKCNDDILKSYLKAVSRTCYDLKDVSQNPAMTTDYNEIDTVGIIFSIDPSNQEFDLNKNQFQNMYLADIDKNLICVIFWGGIKKFGYESVLDTGQVIYCGNLLKRAGNSRKNIPQFRATESTVFTKTPKNEKAREMVDEMNKRMYGLDRRKFCEDCVAVKQNFSALRCFNDGENVSPYRFDKSDYNLGRNKAFIETPALNAQRTLAQTKKSEDLNLTGLDFESTFRQQDTQLSPKTLERKKKVNEKIAKLKMYGEPPPLSPINLINKSKNATSSYKSPLIRDETSNSANVASGNKLPSVATPVKLPDNNVNIDGQNTVSSPIISNVTMNRTYVKRSINPVKLSFSEICDDSDRTVDHFAEEFDSSLPLSLD